MIAVLDDGVDYTHPDLADSMWRNLKEHPDNGVDDDGNGAVDDVYGVNTIGGEWTSSTILPVSSEEEVGTSMASIVAASYGNSIGISGAVGGLAGDPINAPTREF